MAVKGDLRTRLGEELMCAICCDQYKDPRMLPCRHAFCKRCLEEYQESREQQRDILVCPVCKKATNLPPQGISSLPADFKMKSIVDVMQDTELSDPVPAKSSKPGPLPMRPFLDYTAKARARPLLTVTSYGDGEPFGCPYGLAFGTNGIIVISDWKMNKLIFFDKHMKFKSVTGTSSWFSRNDCLNKPSGLASDPDGNIYVADRDNHCVKKFSILGKFISKVGTGKPGSRNGEFNEPRALAVSSKNILYVVDALNNRIQVFNGDKFQLSFGSLGSEPGQLHLPRGVTLNSAEDQVFVADNKNSRVQIFSSQQGLFLREIVHDKLCFPLGISCNGDGHLFVCSSNNRVIVFREDGTMVTTIEGNLDGEERFNKPAEAKLNNNGQIIIVSKCGSIVVL